MPQTHHQPPYQSTNPTQGDVVARFDAASDQLISDSLTAGAAAFEQWSAVPIQERAQAALRVAALFEQQADELARLATEEMGKPLHEAQEEVEFCRDIFTYYGERGPTLAEDQEIETFSGDRAFVQRLPIGLLLGVMPWNFPFYQVARFAAPNMVLGNTMLLKPAESVPRCALALQNIFEEAEVPTGVYQNIFATFEQVERIIGDQRVQGVSLTGSDRAGAAVAEIAGRNLKKCVLELGGSDPYVVLDTEDVVAEAAQAWETRVYNTGQACNSNKRIIVMDSFFDPFVDELTELAKAMRPGDPLTPSDDTYGPMSSRAAAERLVEQVEDAVAKGAKLHAGGALGESAGAYYQPAVLTGVTPQMRAYSEELFGPVAVVYAASDEEEALKLANDTVYGLGGAVFSSDPEKARSAASELAVGMANVNTPAGEGAEIPFGGVKRSGFGRELGPLGMDEFVNKRMLYVSQPGT